MSRYNVSTMISFWSLDIVMRDIQSASKAEFWDYEGKKLAQFMVGKKQTLEQFGDNRYLLRIPETNDFVEFYE